ISPCSPKTAWMASLSERGRERDARDQLGDHFADLVQRQDQVRGAVLDGGAGHGRCLGPVLALARTVPPGSSSLRAPAAPPIPARVTAASRARGPKLSARARAERLQPAGRGDQADDVASPGLWSGARGSRCCRAASAGDATALTVLVPFPGFPRWSGKLASCL